METSSDDREDLGLGLKPGDTHYRAYVGPPEDYDLIAAMTFNLLTTLGLRQHHCLLDVGCGSLRIGRLLIPYLNRGKYFGVEPNEWLVEEGIRRELGETLMQIKRATFFFSDSPETILEAKVVFDFALAQSIFSHCGLDLIRGWLSAISRSLAEDGALVATFLIGEEDSLRAGWIYPECVNYRPATLERSATEVNLRFEILDWKHPRQTWALFAAPGFDSSWFKKQPLTWNTGLERALSQKHQPISQSLSDQNIFAGPLKVEDVADCYFYHTMELPGHGVIEGRDWDLRGRVDEYLGKVDFAGQRVLEIGPASGFLTFEMERRGADVVSVEVTDEHGWDFVPYPAARLEEVFGPRRIVMQQLKNSYWFSHAALQSKAKVYYGDVYNLPAALGEFDIAVMGSVLLHCRDPLRIVEQCGKIARLLIITDMLYPELEGAPICCLAPTAQNFLWHTWWHFSTQFFTQFLAVIGFTASETSTHQQYHRGRAYTLFTVVGRDSEVDCSA